MSGGIGIANKREAFSSREWLLIEAWTRTPEEMLQAGRAWRQAMVLVKSSAWLIPRVEAWS